MITRISLLAFVASAVIFGGAILAASPARALCVNNGTATPVRIVVHVGGIFETTVQPGDMQCCDWQAQNCNSGGSPDSFLQFMVTALSGPQVKTGVCRGTIPASFELQIQQSGANIRCIGVR